MALFIACITLFGVLPLTGIAFRFWEAPWVVGVVAVVVFSSTGIMLLMFDDDPLSKPAAAFFGIIYSLASLAIYSFWSWKHIGWGLSFAEFAGFLVLWALMRVVSSAYLKHYRAKGLLSIPAWGYAIACLASAFAVPSKYIILERSSRVGILGELLVVIIGGAAFFNSYYTRDLGWGEDDDD